MKTTKQICTKCNQNKSIEEYALEKATHKLSDNFMLSRVKGEIIEKNGAKYSITYRRRKDCRVCKKAVGKAYKSRPEIVAKTRARNKKLYASEDYKKKHLAWKIQYIAKRSKTDHLFDMKNRVRALIREVVRKKGYGVDTRSRDILGIEYEGFIKHIESLFRNGMSWANRTTWHLDHIIPMSSATTESQILKLNHYTNFRPLWAKENIKRGDNMDYQIDWNNK